MLYLRTYILLDIYFLNSYFVLENFVYCSLPVQQQFQSFHCIWPADIEFCKLQCIWKIFTALNFFHILLCYSLIPKFIKFIIFLKKLKTILIQLRMGIVYILSIAIPIPILFIGINRYCYPYNLVKKEMMWKVVENVKLFYYCWTLATVLKFFRQGQSFIFLFVFYFINIKGIVHP